MRRTILLTTLGLVTAATLVGCSGSGSGNDDAAAEPGTEESQATELPAGDLDLMTAETSLGELVVDGQGMTAYYFLQDTAGSGTSACTGGCLTAWPPVLAATRTPAVEGVTAEVGTIETPEGDYQVTVDDRPVYRYAQDTTPGDVNGQGVNEVWYAVAPDGAQVGP